MDKTIEELKKEYEELTAKFNALCDEQENLPREGFAKVFEVLDGMEETFTPQHPYTENEDIINKALERTGHSDDEAFCKAFKRNNQIMIDGKKIQAKGLEILAMQQYKKIKEEPKSPNEWQFVSINIVAPKQIQEEIIAPMIEADAKEGKGLFQNVSDIEEESEDEDALLMVEIYNCKATMTRYWDELKQFGVIGKGKSDAFFKYEFRTILLNVLNELATFMRQNTDKPAQTKNHIASTIKTFDKMPIWGLFFQILTLQGLCRWLESVNISEGDNGFDEAKSLHGWLCEILVDKEVAFCYMPFGDEDKKQLKPLCNFLQSTEIGKEVQNFIFGSDKESEPQQENNTPMAGELTLPSKLDTERARRYFAKAIEAQYIKKTESGLQWVFGSDRGRKVSLGYFIQKVYCPNNTEDIPEKAVNQLFGVERIGSAISQIQNAKKPQKWRKTIDILFE